MHELSHPSRTLNSQNFGTQIWRRCVLHDAAALNAKAVLLGLRLNSMKITSHTPASCPCHGARLAASVYSSFLRPVFERIFNAAAPVSKRSGQRNSCDRASSPRNIVFLPLTAHCTAVYTVDSTGGAAVSNGCVGGRRCNTVPLCEIH